LRWKLSKVTRQRMLLRRTSELAQEFGVHVNQINLWKKQLLEAAPKVFSRGKDREAERIVRERDRLYRKVGQLQIEVDWLKKKTGLLD